MLDEPEGRAVTGARLKRAAAKIAVTLHAMMNLMWCCGTGQGNECKKFEMDLGLVASGGRQGNHDNSPREVSVPRYKTQADSLSP